jgi:hypothetical protein
MYYVSGYVQMCHCLAVCSQSLIHSCSVTDAAMYNNSGALPTSPMAPTTYGTCD